MAKIPLTIEVKMTEMEPFQLALESIKIAKELKVLSCEMLGSLNIGGSITPNSFWHELLKKTLEELADAEDKLYDKVREQGSPEEAKNL